MEVPNQIAAIAKIVKQDWQNVYFGAVPYLKAMSQLEHINQMHYEESAASVVRYFLSNAKSWRGETARAVKAKLNQLLND